MKVRQRLRAQLPVAAQARAGGDRREQAADRARARASAEARDAEELKEAQALQATLEALEIAIARRVGENETLYGSVTSADIADALAARDLAVDRRRIQLPIR